MGTLKMQIRYANCHRWDSEAGGKERGAVKADREVFDEVIAWGKRQSDRSDAQSLATSHGPRR
jgi:hypothetical protein